MVGAVAVCSIVLFLEKGGDVYAFPRISLRAVTKYTNEQLHIQGFYRK